MRRLFVVSTFTLAMLGSYAARAEAQIGPVCLRPNPFANVIVFFFTSTGANQMVGSGRDLATQAPASATVFFTGGTAVVGFIVHTPPTGTSHLFAGSASVSTASGSGPGRCETLNTTTGCGLGTAITMAIVPCPSDALTDKGAAAEPKGPLAGGSQ